MCLVVLTEEESVAGRLQDIIWLARARTKREVGNRRFGERVWLWGLSELLKASAKSERYCTLKKNPRESWAVGFIH
jgi:hypothetical protein